MRDSEEDDKFLSTMYQDGLIHEIEYIVSSSTYGIKIADLKVSLKERKEVLKKYERDEEKYHKAKTEEEKNRRMNIIIQIAYFTGRVEVLSRFLKGMKEPIPSDL